MKFRSFALGIALFAIPATTAPAQIAPCWGDITHDLSVNVVDLLEVITNWGPCVGAPPTGNNSPGAEDGGPPPVVYCAADIAPPANPDGMIDVNDLLLVVSGWGPCAVPPPSQGEGYVVWCEDWANANYARWTSAYNGDTDPCTVAGFDTTRFQSPSMSMHSQVTCVGGVNGVHRGYGGLRFFGEYVLPNFATPSAGGIQAPYGIVIQFRNYLSVPYLFNAQDYDLWMSMLTVTDDCSNAWHRVITLNIDDTTMRLRPQHVTGVQYVFGAPSFPRDVWNRVTVYVNIGEGTMHVWQNGIKICQAWFTRPTAQACQFHFGLYCSGANSNISYYEDDFRIIKLTQPLTNFQGEPAFPNMTSQCATPP
jgi:hypothetical protein